MSDFFDRSKQLSSPINNHVSIMDRYERIRQEVAATEQKIFVIGTPTEEDNEKRELGNRDIRRRRLPNNRRTSYSIKTSRS